MKIIGGWRTVVLKMGGTGWDEANRSVECQRSRGVGRGAWGDLRGGVSKYFNNEHVCRKKHLRILLG